MPFVSEPIHWRGPVLGTRVSHAWLGYARVIFLEFGPLTPSTVIRKDGSLGNATGTRCLSTAASYCRWSLTISGHHFGSSTDSEERCSRALTRLIGCTLLGLQIDPRSKATKLSFTRDVVLSTRGSFSSLKCPHWGIRRPLGDLKIYSDLVPMRQLARPTC